MTTKIIKAWIDGAIQNIEVEEMTSPEQPLSVEERVDTLEGKHEVVISEGSMLVGDGTPELKEMTPEEVLEHINGASVMALTSTEYEALEEYDINVLYALTDGNNSDIYVQDEEPVNVEEGSLWVDMDAVGTVGSGSSNGSNGSSDSSFINLDTTLTREGYAADAKAVGDALAEKQPKGSYLTEVPDGYATEEYVNNKIAENSGSSESSDVFVVTIDYEHKTASHSASEIKVAYESGEIVVTADEFGTLIPLCLVNENVAIFQYIYDNNTLESTEITVGENKQVTLDSKKCSVKVPHFDFANMGMSPIPMPAGTVTFVHDMTDIMESLANGAVSIRVPCSSDGTTTFYFDCYVMGHKRVGDDCVQVSVPAFLFNQAGESIGNFLVTAIIFANRAIINVEPFNASGGSASGSSGIALVVLDEEDMTSSFTASQIKEAVANSKHIMIMANGVISDAIVTYDPTLDFVNLHVAGHRSETQLRAMSFKVNNDGTILALVDNMEIVPPLDDIADGKVLMSSGGTAIWTDVPTVDNGTVSGDSNIFVINVIDGSNLTIDKTFAEIKAAKENGMMILSSYLGMYIHLSNYDDRHFYFESYPYHYNGEINNRVIIISSDNNVECYDNVTYTTLIIKDNGSGKSTVNYNTIVNSEAVKIFRYENVDLYFTSVDASGKKVYFDTAPSMYSGGIATYQVTIDSNNNIEYHASSNYTIPQYSEADFGKILKATSSGPAWSFNNDANAFSASGVKF